MRVTARRCERLYNALNRAYCRHAAAGAWDAARRVDNAMCWLESWAFVNLGVEL